MREVGDSDNDYVTLRVADFYIKHGCYFSALEALREANLKNYYVAKRTADCHVLLGDFGKAHAAYAQVYKLGSRAQMNIDDIWSLKLISGDIMSGAETLTLLGPAYEFWEAKH